MATGFMFDAHYLPADFFFFYFKGPAVLQQIFFAQIPASRITRKNRSSTTNISSFGGGNNLLPSASIVLYLVADRYPRFDAYGYR